MNCTGYATIKASLIPASNIAAAQSGTREGELKFISEETEYGITERRFDIVVKGETVPGIIWAPEGAEGSRPVVLILTSNLPGDPKDFFRPEFINRVDDIVRFTELTVEDLVEIVDIQLASLADRLADRRVALEVSDEAKSLLAKIGYDPAFGARPLKRVIQSEVADELAMQILDGHIEDGAKVQVDVNDDGSGFTFGHSLPLDP